MVRMKRFTFFILYIILFQRVFGDTLVTGTVFHRVTNQPIGNVNVYIDNSEVGTSTSAEGKFELKITDGDSLLIFEHIAFKKTSKKLKQISSDISIYLEPKVISLSELDVLGVNENGNFIDLNTKNMVSDIAVKDIAFRTYSDIGDILMNEESVLVDESSRGVKTVSIRGARQEEMSFLYDGVPVYHGGRTSLDLSMFDIGGMEEIEVLRGSHERASGSSGTINFVPSLTYGNSANFYQRFGTYNTGGYNGNFSVGNQSLSFNMGSGRSESRQFYEDVADVDILRSSSNTFITIGTKILADTEIKLSNITNNRNYTNYFTLDSVNSSYSINTLKIEKSSNSYGSLDLYISDQSSIGNDAISALSTARDDKQFLSGFHYTIDLENAFFDLNVERAQIKADWETSSNNIDLSRSLFSYSSTFGVSKNKSRDGLEIKEFILNINSNNTEDKKNSESDILSNISWQNSGVNFLFSAWDHLDNAIIYVYSNFGSGFRVPSINERYFHALRPVDSVQDSLLLEGKIMKEVGLKISSIDTESSPRFRGSMSYFNYQYKNKIKTIQYSASPLQFPLNDGSAFISGVELNAELFTLNDLLGLRSIYSAYNYSDQLSFPMQPISSLRNSIMVNLGNMRVKVSLKKEGSRVLTTIGDDGVLENNYLEDYQSFDINASYLINFRDFKASVAIFGQNLNDDSQVLEGISIFDKRFYLSLGIQWK